MKLRSVFLLFRWWILLAIGLVVVENVAWIIEPSLFGPVIDALIDNATTSSWAPALQPLLLWMGVFAINSGVGAFRRAYDQNIYLSIYTNLATRVTELSRSRGLTTSRTAARTQLAREFISIARNLGLEMQAPQMPAREIRNATCQDAAHHECERRGIQPACARH